MDERDVTEALETSPGRHGVAADVLNDALPVAVLVIDTVGTIRFANQRLEALTGISVDDYLGSSVFDLVDARDLDFLMTSVADASNYDNVVMGPSRVRYRLVDGEVRWTEFWSFACPPSFGFEGYIVTLSPESVPATLAGAAFRIASGEPLETTLETVARAASGYPLTAEGSIIFRGDDGVCVVGSWPGVLDAHVDDPAMPWHRTLENGVALDLDVGELPTSVRSSAERAGYGSLWIRGLPTQRGRIAGVIVAWRRERRPASPNQNRHLAEMVAVARLAVDHDEHRVDLERAAFVDPLTGIGNRAAADRVIAEDAPLAVLYLDLDGFKAINDTFGHAVGDHALVEATRRVNAVVRRDDAVFRMGGDEFVILLDGRPGPIGPIADRLVDAMSAPTRLDGFDVTLAASIGVARRRASETREQTVRRADDALLAAKRAGKSRWRGDPDDTHIVRSGRTTNC
jgi:diguanylate cyclase (GGDEF)-like protein/PAS domain S-box-containing protein